MESVSHPIIKPGLLEDRVYQSRIAEAATHHNTLVVLPTGLGKTAIALRVIADALHREPGRSVLFLAPTRPLVIQHGRSVAHALDIPPPVVLTGNVPPREARGAAHHGPGGGGDAAGHRQRPRQRRAQPGPVLPPGLRRGAPGGRRLPVRPDRSAEPGRSQGTGPGDDGVPGSPEAADPGGLAEPRHRAVRVPDRPGPRCPAVPPRHRGGDGGGAGPPRGPIPGDPPSDGRPASGGRPGPGPPDGRDRRPAPGPPRARGAAPPGDRCVTPS